MVIATVLALTIASGTLPDTIPTVTLEEALRAAVDVDPNYVQAVGQLEVADWGRRAVRLALLTPSVSMNAGYSRSSSSQFNIGTGARASANGFYSVDASYTLFNGGTNWQNARRAGEQLEAAEAGELGQRFLSALETERDYYEVLGATELLEVARDRATRAGEQLALARARVVSGATVHSDSLQILLEVQRADAELMRREAALEVAQLQLGRRIGAGGPLNAAPLGPDATGPLPLTLAEAIHLAVSQGPRWRTARATERAAEAAHGAGRGSYLPTIALGASLSAFDDKFVPTETRRRSIGINLSWSLWDGGRRELGLARSAAERDLARAIRVDLERSARRDVTEAYAGYDVARRTLLLARSAVTVATEVLRVQEARYRAGQSTVLELLDAQSQLVQTQAGLVLDRYALRLAKTTLEAILGRRFDPAFTASQP